MKQKMYLITGLMACGKSTISDLLAKSLEKCVHLRGDVFRKMIVSGREDMSDSPSVEVIVLCPNVEVIKERELNRGKTGYAGFVVEELYNTFMQTIPKIGFWLDNSNQTPKQTVETILNRK